MSAGTWVAAVVVVGCAGCTDREADFAGLWWLMPGTTATLECPSRTVTVPLDGLSLSLEPYEGGVAALSDFDWPACPPLVLHVGGSRATASDRVCVETFGPDGSKTQLTISYPSIRMQIDTTGTLLDIHIFEETTAIGPAPSDCFRRTIVGLASKPSM
jgi:hypothetical protein